MKRQISYPAELPIISHKQSIIDAITYHPVVIISGDTGSGKSTQLPKFCLEAGRGQKKMIGCTQPRRIAATSVAARVAEELGPEGPALVGYKIRFSDRTSKSTRIKFMTDGMLLAETQGHKSLDAYDTLIIDEAHERSLNIDFLLGYLRTLIQRRKDLKLIITSATIDTDKFSSHFGNAPVIQVSGRTYPVSIRYHTIPEDALEGSHVTESVQAAVTLCTTEKPGDILIFMPTESDIRETIEQLNGELSKRLSGRLPVVIPLFGRLRAADQNRIFKLHKNIKIVVATNVAETSITVPGIKYVIDSGLARISTYNARARTTGLPVTKISKASCDQRTGRCGRTAAGICIRMFSEDDYEHRVAFTLPEIKRSNLAEVILRMISLKFGEIANFPFLEPPNARSIRVGYKLLWELHAITNKNGEWHLTPQGRIMARLPIDPSLSKIIIEARDHSAVREAIILSAALSIADPRIRPVKNEDAVDTIHARFAHASSDFCTLIQLWDTYNQTHKKIQSKSGMRKFCRTHFLSYQRMREWHDIHDQIHTILKENTKFHLNQRKATYDEIHRSLICGFLRNIAVKKTKNMYQGSNNKEVMIFPGSGQFHKGGKWIVAAEFIETSKLFARTVATIKAEWIEPAGSHLCNYSYTNPRWEKTKGQVIADEKVTLFGLIIAANRKVNYAKISAKTQQESRNIFIHRALVGGELSGRYPFLTKNLNLVKNLEDLEDRYRQRGVVADDYTLYKFYDSRLAAHVFNQAGLNTFLKEKNGDSFLTMKDEDITARMPSMQLREDFPQKIQIDDFCFPLSYSFNPGNTEDGVTVNLPIQAISHIAPAPFEWLVPGLLKEKIIQLLRGLPKNIRKKLIPVSQTADRLLEELIPYQTDLYHALSTLIYKQHHVIVERRLWVAESLPDHLRIRYRVVDNANNQIKISRNFYELHNLFDSKKENPNLVNIKEKLERDAISTWDFKDLPGKVPVQTPNGLEGYLFPALTVIGRDAGTSQEELGIRIFEDFNESRKQTRQGLLILYKLHFTKEIKLLQREIKALFSKDAETLSLIAWLSEKNHFSVRVLTFILEGLFETQCGEIPAEDIFIEKIQKIKKDGLFLKGTEILHIIKSILQDRRDVHRHIMKFEKRRPASGTLQDQHADFHDELARLLPADFLLSFDFDKLRRVCRYLQALSIRVERAYASPEKDAQKARQLIPFRDRLAAWQMAAVPTQECLKACEEFRVMLEEFKISLFAQEMKTIFPVSAKRLEKKWKDLQLVC